MFIELDAELLERYPEACIHQEAISGFLDDFNVNQSALDKYLGQIVLQEAKTADFDKVRERNIAPEDTLLRITSFKAYYRYNKILNKLDVNVKLPTGYVPEWFWNEESSEEARLQQIEVFAGTIILTAVTAVNEIHRNYGLKAEKAAGKYYTKVLLTGSVSVPIMLGLMNEVDVTDRVGRFLAAAVGIGPIAWQGITGRRQLVKEVLPDDFDRFSLQVSALPHIKQYAHEVLTLGTPR